MSYFFECCHHLRVVFELSFFKDWNNTYLTLSLRRAVFRLSKNEFDLGNEEEATVNADLLRTFSEQHVLEVN